jgi:D-glycero-alpha-D-manno-heptose-7-phosphate kinase
MIITKTPYRISFFGGGSDYPVWYNKNGGQVLSTTIDKHIYLTCRYLPSFFNHRFRIIWSKIEQVKSVEKIQHPAVKGLLKYLKVKKGLEIHYDGDLPAKSGMGSSSCFSVGLMKALSILNKKNLHGLKLAKKAIFFEQKIMKEVVGSQDQIASSIGGFNKIKFLKNDKFIINRIPKKNLNNLNSNLMLLFTGIQRKAHNIAKNYVNKLSNKKEKNVLKIMKFVDVAERLILNNDLHNFGRLMNEAWQEKKLLSKTITNNKIDNLYNYALRNGALGGKLLGAGGGGFLLLYVPKEKQLGLSRKLKNLIHVPFRFSYQGSHEILNTVRK